MFYIYVYLDPRKPCNKTYNGVTFTHEPFYIGKGKDSRHLSHLREAKDLTIINPKTTKIRKLWKSNLEPIITKIAEFVNENDAYDYEANMIEIIGSNFCPDVKNGTLVNICKDNRPPNHKGKSYQDIYGSDAQKEIEKRRKTQLERGGFGPSEFSQETKQKLSRIQSGKGNGHYGKRHSAKAKAKIGASNSHTQMWLHKGHYYTIEDPHGNIYQFYGSLVYFSEINGISRSTLYLNYTKGAVCTRGKTKGWRILSKK